MWFFEKKISMSKSGVLAGGADHHSHILPGVDDGVETMEEALLILSQYETLGIKTLWLTPHIMEDIPNTPQQLSARFNELKATYNGNIKLCLAAEYMMDGNLSRLLDDGEELLPIGNAGKHLLVETSYFIPPMRLQHTLEQIGSLGYHPLLAHPERYMYMDESDYRQLHQKGVKFQLNLASLAGGYGSVVKKKAQWLLQNSYYTICGSDLHCEDAIELITKCKLSEKEMAQVKSLLQNSI